MWRMMYVFHLNCNSHASYNIVLIFLIRKYIHIRKLHETHHANINLQSNTYSIIDIVDVVMLGVIRIAVSKDEYVQLSEDKTIIQKTSDNSVQCLQLSHGWLQIKASRPKK